MEYQTGKENINTLLQCSQVLFSLVANLRSGDRETQPAEDFRERILQGFDEMERLAFELQIPMVTLKDAKYAIAALIDEAVLCSDWEGRIRWMSHSLQLEMFGDHVAGEGFFERLAQLRQIGEANLELIELYYVCLQLGFEGIYKVRGLEQLMALQVDLRSQIEGYRGVVDPRLAPQGVPREGVLARVRREVPCWVIAVTTTAVIFFGYVGYAYTIDRMASQSVLKMEAEGRPLGRLALDQRPVSSNQSEVHP
jgi:type VI secretion system protein ImpK